MTRWAQFVDCDGSRFDLSHFHDHVRAFRLAPTVARPKAREVVVRVSFSLHCFTRAAVSGEVVSECQIYHKNEQGRLFCPQRHGLGFELGRILDSILDKNCYLTDQKNRVLFSAVQSLAGDEYAVFFTLRRASKCTGADANMMVLSAHARAGFRPGGKPAKFRYLLGTVA